MPGWSFLEDDQLGILIFPGTDVGESLLLKRLSKGW